MTDDDLFKDAMKMKKHFNKARERLGETPTKTPRAPGVPVAKPESMKRKMLYETENSYIIVLRVSWAKKEDVKVAYDLKRIEIKIENSYRKFHKMLNLPGYAVPHAGKATFTADILRIELPKFKNTTTKLSIEGDISGK